MVSRALGNLRRFLKPTEEVAHLGNKKAQVIAVTAQKGGVGKTTTAVHLAAGLAMFHKRRVLLLDMDAQGHVQKSLAKDMPEHIHDETMGSLLLKKNRDLYEIAAPTKIEDLWVVPSDRSLNETETMLSTRIGKELMLRQNLSVARTHFDVILIDCPPNLGNLTVNALVASDQVLIPCDMSILSLDGVSSIVETVATVQEMLNPSLGLLGLLRTRLDRRNITMNRTIEETLREQYGDFLLESVIGVSTAIAKAQLAGQSVFHFAPKNQGAKSYKKLSDEVSSLLSPQ